MPVAFGFSVGDFIAALELIGTVIDALRDTGNASSNFKILVEEIEELKFTLLQVQQIRLDPRLQHVELGIDAAAERGLLNIEKFWHKIGKFERHFYASGKRLNIKEIIARIKFSVWKKDDIEDFRARIQRSNTTFSILLATVHIHIANLDTQDRNKRYNNIASTVTNYGHQIISLLNSILKGVSSGTQQISFLLAASYQITATTINIITKLQAIHQIVSSISPEVMYYRRVDFIDCFGRSRPFFLETITCREHLIAMLKIDLERAQCSYEDKVLLEQDQFMIVECSTDRIIDTRLPWDQCFAPGQRIAMDMIFAGPPCFDKCIKCQTPGQRYSEIGLVCPKCGIYILQKPETLQELSTRFHPLKSSPGAEDPLASTKFRRLRLLQFELDDHHHMAPFSSRRANNILEASMAAPDEGTSPYHSHRAKFVAAGEAWMAALSPMMEQSEYTNNNDQDQTQERLVRFREAWRHLRFHHTASNALECL